MRLQTALRVTGVDAFAYYASWGVAHLAYTGVTVALLALLLPELLLLHVRSLLLIVVLLLGAVGFATIGAHFVFLIQLKRSQSPGVLFVFTLTIRL